jgi:glycine/D-amino acid oxidase-like deaminating enzyme
MDLSSGELYWPTTCSRSTPARQLDADISCDALVIGAGITGAMAAVHLARAGLSVVMVDRRTVAAGSTAASTAMIMYETDLPLVELKAMVGVERAARAYQASRRALDLLAELVDTLDDSCDLAPRRGLYLASLAEDVDSFLEEISARSVIGINAEFLDRSALEAVFGISRPGAILSDAAYEINPVRLTRALIRDAEALGVRVFDRTEVECPPCESTPHTITTHNGNRVTCDAVVIATGYETPERFAQVRSLTTLKSTYACASAPIDGPLWPGNVLIWESARPYTYMRTAPGGRVLLGGEDTSVVDPALRDRHIHTNALRLIDKAATIVPHLQLTPEFAWAGTFAETDDSLPLIGALDPWPGVYFALGYGGNGISFSVLAAHIIRDIILNKPNPYAETFSIQHALRRPQAI